MLAEGGVYVLYRGSEPHYVGKATRLRGRLYSHARPNDRYYNFWDHFSAFAIPDPAIRAQIEGILIAAMPTTNGAKPRIRREKMPLDIQKQIQKLKYATLQLNPKKPKF